MKIMAKMATILIKGVLGIVAIYLTNLALESLNLAVGLNVYNGIAIGILGISGFLLLYALVIIDSTLLT